MEDKRDKRDLAGIRDNIRDMHENIQGDIREIHEDLQYVREDLLPEE